MASYLLDTNHASRLLSKDALFLEKIQQLTESGSDFGISMTVLGELYYAVYASQRRKSNLERLNTLLTAMHIYPFDQAAAEVFGDIQAGQKAKGRPIPPLDAQIAAVARVQQLTLLTADRHFSFVDDLQTENWL